MMRKFNLLSKVYAMGYLWDLNFSLECLFYCIIFEKKKTFKKTLFLQYILLYIIYLLNLYTHISVTEYIKERCLYITTIYFLITN